MRNAFLPLTAICNGWSFLSPRFVGIEPTNRCSLNCIMCARSYWDSRDNKLGDMPVELFENKVLPFLRPKQTVNLQCQGEPLLAEHFFEMAGLLKLRGCKVIFTSNGTLFKQYARKIVESGIDSVTVSIDGIKSLERIRNININLLTDGIREINLLKQELKRNYPGISIHFVAMKDNVQELPDLVDLAHQLKIKVINVIRLVIHSGGLSEQNIFKHMDLAKKYFNIAYHKAKKMGIRINLPALKGKIRFCRQPFEAIYINWNLDVRPCCSATINEKDTLKLGNLNDASLDELWNGRMMRKLRLAVLRNRRLPEFCKNCPMRIYSSESHIRIL